MELQELPHQTNIKVCMPTDVYLSPCFVFARMRSIAERNQLAEILKSRKLQQEKESWISAVYLQAIAEFEKIPHWLRACQDNTPDVEGIKILWSKHGNELLTYSLEVCEYESHAQKGILDVLKRKLEKSYPRHFTILCYAHSRCEEHVDVENLADGICASSPLIKDVWIINSKDELGGEYIVTRVFPKPIIQLELDINDDSHFEKQEPILKISGRGRSSSKEFEKLGIAYIPIPKLIDKKLKVGLTNRID